MIRSGLIGRSILASRSPELHEREAQAQGLELTYELIDFTDRGWPDADLRIVLDRLLANGFSGFNVTYPFKQAILPLLDSLDESAITVGAVNTVAIRQGKLIGFNTDMAGFRDSLIHGLPDAQLDCVMQFGAGGAGAAVASALLSIGVRHLALVDVDEGRAVALAADLAVRFPLAKITVSRPELADTRAANGIVNATPIGMKDKPGLPLAANLIHSTHWVVDIIYFPPETELLHVAKEVGCKTLNGIGMVVGQAARAFEIITGHMADSSRMSEILA